MSAADCYCDYETPEFYSATEHTARKLHRCDECRGDVAPGTRYESAAGKNEGDFWQSKTCSGCLALRAWVTAHLPCFCWAHTQMLESADDYLKQYQCAVPGLGMEYGRMRVRARQRNRARRARLERH